MLSSPKMKDGNKTFPSAKVCCKKQRFCKKDAARNKRKKRNLHIEHHIASFACNQIVKAQEVLVVRFCFLRWVPVFTFPVQFALKGAGHFFLSGYLVCKNVITSAICLLWFRAWFMHVLPSTKLPVLLQQCALSSLQSSTSVVCVQCQIFHSPLCTEHC